MFLVLVVTNLHQSNISVPWYHSFSFSLSLAHSHVLFPDVTRFARVACEDREKKRDRETETDGALFLFLCTQPKVPTKVGGVPKNKTREQAQAVQKKTKGEIYVLHERKREIFYI